MGRRGRRGYPAEFRQRVVELLAAGRKVADTRLTTLRVNLRTRSLGFHPASIQRTDLLRSRSLRGRGERVQPSRAIPRPDARAHLFAGSETEVLRSTCGCEF